MGGHRAGARGGGGGEGGRVGRRGEAPEALNPKQRGDVWDDEAPEASRERGRKRGKERGGFQHLPRNSLALLDLALVQRLDIDSLRQASPFGLTA